VGDHIRKRYKFRGTPNVKSRAILRQARRGKVQRQEVDSKIVNSICNDYTVNMLTQRDIAKKYGIKRGVIIRILKESHIASRSRHYRRTPQHRTFTCNYCGREFNDLVAYCNRCHPKHYNDYIKILEAATTIISGTLFTRSSWDSLNCAETHRGNEKSLPA